MAVAPAPDQFSSAGAAVCTSPPAGLASEPAHLTYRFTHRTVTMGHADYDNVQYRGIIDRPHLQLYLDTVIWTGSQQLELGRFGIPTEGAHCVVHYTTLGAAVQYIQRSYPDRLVRILAHLVPPQIDLTTYLIAHWNLVVYHYRSSRRDVLFGQYDSAHLLALLWTDYNLHG